MRRFLLALAILALPRSVHAQQSFDLGGPALTITVTRGGVILPLSAVPHLAAGDRVTARADLSDDQSARYLLIVAFLRGSTNPPPKKWFARAETWKPRKDVVGVTVPAGAQQAIAFLAPETGGGFDAVVDAVRGRPGVFVRAAQDLHQASLDRGRLEAFVAGIARTEERAPERLATVSSVLANALAIRLNAECLTRPRVSQAACLTQNRDGLVLQTTRGTSLTDTLAGMPTDLAYRIAATREGGAGYYSPYIGLARDLARLFGAFRTAQYQYLPTLAVGDGDALGLRLNAAPSFQNPRSVLVVPLPPIAVAAPPTWHVAAGRTWCIGRGDLVLPVDEAPYLYSTGYARVLALRVQTASGGSVEVPVTPDALRGGLVVTDVDGRIGAGTIVSATLHGRWGFDPLPGAGVTVANGAAAAWTPQPDAPVIVGRDHALVLAGGAPACVDRVALRDTAGRLRALDWKEAGADRIAVTLPLTDARPGAMTLLVTQAGRAEPWSVDLTAQAEASRITGFAVHEGDADGVLAGSRLDQVAELRIGAVRFVPGALTREKDGDRLILSRPGAAPPLRAGETQEAVVRLRDGRSLHVATRIAPSRPRVMLVSRNVEPRATERVRLVLPDTLLPLGGQLTFSIRTIGGSFEDGDAIEVAAGTSTAVLSVAAGSMRRVGADVAIATVRPRSMLGPDTVGPMRFRIIRGDTAGDWQPLTRLVRLPSIEAIACRAEAVDCTLTGRDLFALAAVSDTSDFARAVSLPEGFVGRRVELPWTADRTLYLRLRDAPDVVVGAIVADPA